MEKIDIVLWVISGGFSLMMIMWHYINQKIDNVDKSLGQRIDNVDKSLSQKIEKLDEKVTDIDRRLCRLEGAFASKDCCMIKDDRNLRKAE